MWREKEGSMEKWIRKCGKEAERKRRKEKESDCVGEKWGDRL